MMLAGADIASATPVIEATKAAVFTVRSPSRNIVERAIVSAVQAELVKRIEAQVLSPYKFTIDEFTRSGLRDRGPDAFAQVRQDIEHVRLGCEFLVFGFDERNLPSIFHVKERGIVDDHARTGFWAIGTGDYAAIGALVFHDYSRQLDIPEALYYVCMSKFMAERAELGVGVHLN